MFTRARVCGSGHETLRSWQILALPNSVSTRKHIDMIVLGIRHIDFVNEIALHSVELQCSNVWPSKGKVNTVL